MSADGKPLHKPESKPSPNAMDHKSSAENRQVFNTPDNAIRAVSTARDCLKTLSPGKIWTDRAPHGEPELKGSCLLEGAPILVLHFSTDDASLLPKGLHSFSPIKSEIISLAETRLQEITQRITVLDGAEFREPESCWAIPVAHNGRIVGHLKVSSDGTTLLTEKKAGEREV